jgi:hypothetical protein
MRNSLNLSFLLLLILPALSFGKPISTDESTALVTKIDSIENKSQYTLPMAIPNTQQERQELIAQISTASEPQLKKKLYLTRLAFLTNQPNALLADIEVLEKEMASLREALPKDPELMAAYGSLIAFKTTFYLDNLSKLSVLSRQGNRLMDRAIKLDPKHLGARLQRGIACAHMPSFVRRARYAVEDLELIKKQIENQYGEEFTQFIEYYLALSYSRNRRLSDAKDLWKKLAMGENGWSEKSKLALKDL